MDVKVKVKFMPMEVEHEIEFNETVLHLAQRHDIHIQSVCKGIPSCAECRVNVKEGEHHVLPPSSKEISLIGTAHYIDQSRLSCQLRCFGDITVDLTEQIEKEKRAAKRPQGRANRKEGEESFAVKGILIEEYTEDNDRLVANEVKTNEPRPGQDDFYKASNRSQNEKKGQKNQEHRNNRKRNRNRHKKRGPKPVDNP